jgi:hypothetical protein
VAHDFKIVHWIPGCRATHIHQVRQQARAFNMAQKSRAQPRSLVRAFNQAGQIGYHEAAADARPRSVRGDDAEMRLKRGERIIRNFRARGGDARNQRGFSCVGQANQSYVGQQAQFQAQMPFLSVLPILILARRLVPWLGKVLVAAPAVAAPRRDEAQARRGEIEQKFAGFFVVNQRAHRHFEHCIGAGFAVAVRALSMAPGIGAEFPVEAEP